MILRILLLIASAVVLGSCATPYAPSGVLGGFTTIELRPDVWRVGFRGNGYTTGETAQTYWLFRSAELALEKGYDGFEVLSDMKFIMRQPLEDGDDPAKRRHVAIVIAAPAVPPSPEEFSQAAAWRVPDALANSYGGGVRYARGAPVFIYTGGGYSVPMPRYQGDIHLLRKPLPGVPPKVFDARALKAAIAPLMGDQKCGTGNVCPYVHEYLFPKGKL
jgi:hypothetical protein